MQAFTKGWFEKEAQKEKGMWYNHPGEDAASVDFVPDIIIHKR